MAALRMHAERTPNPHSIKWVLDGPIVPDGVRAHFDAPPPPRVSPLAARLFAIEGVRVVYLAANFATVTKREDREWTDLAPFVVAALETTLAAGEDALGPAFEPQAESEGGELVARIQRVLDEEVRPAVALDGGDVRFAGFRAGVVELVLQGSCSGCPSSAATLKHGIEARLRELFPEVLGVVAIPRSL